MNGPATEAGKSPVTARSVAFGLACVVAVNLVMLYNDYYLNNSILIGSHFPTSSMGVLVLLVGGVNIGARALFGVAGLSQGELMLVWSMIGIGGGLGSSAFMRYFPSYAVTMAYYATPSNEYADLMLCHLPDWMVVSKDPSSPAVKWFMEGLPRGGRIPWGAWVVPTAAWTAFLLGLTAFVFGVTSILYRQWSERERLVFPLVQVPLELARDAGPGKLLNWLLSSRLAWLGMAIPVLIHGANGLRAFLPGVPHIPLSWSTYGWFSDRPWSEFNMSGAAVYFTVIGLTFLIPAQLSFSIVAMFVIWRLSFVYVAWLGSGATGYWGNWWEHTCTYQAAGAIVAFAAVLMWNARGEIRASLRGALSGARGGYTGILGARLSVSLMAGGLAVMLGWFLAARVSWWAAAAALVLLLAIHVVMARVVAESGFFVLGTEAVPSSVVMGAVPPSMVTGPTAAVFTLQRGVMMHDFKEILLPFVMNGIRGADQAGQRLRQVLGVFALTVVVALVASAYGRISTYYKYGGVNVDTWANIQGVQNFYNDTANDRKNPPEYPYVGVGEMRIFPVRAAHVGTGALLMAALVVLRERLAWWPVQPFALVVCTGWAVYWAGMWFSIFLGWMAKAGVMQFGGATVYRRALPFFLGLILGETIIASVWTVVCVLTGTPGIPVLPN